VKKPLFNFNDHLRDVVFLSRYRPKAIDCVDNGRPLDLFFLIGVAIFTRPRRRRVARLPDRIKVDSFWLLRASLSQAFTKMQNMFHPQAVHL